MGTREVIMLMTMAFILVTIGFTGGYMVRHVQQPKIAKQERLGIVTATVESMAAVATARMLNMQCTKCHERG